MTTSQYDPTRTTILYDGDCGFCTWSAELLIKRGHYNAIPAQFSPSPPMTPELKKGCETAVYVVEPDGISHRGFDGVMHVLSETGWGWFAKMLLLPPFVWIGRAGYFIIARNRRTISKIFFKNLVCGLPPIPSEPEKKKEPTT